MKITRVSFLSKKTHTREIDVTSEQLKAYAEGGLLIQDALPHLSADDREYLITGSTPEEWDEAFGGEE